LTRAGWFLLLIAISAAPLVAQVRVPAFVEIPAGPFTIGADRSTDPMAFDNEKWSSAAAEGTLDLSAFFIAPHEVTAGEFAIFAQDGKWSVDPRAVALQAGHPVAFVSWPDAIAYCRWLEAKLKSSSSTPPRIAQALAAGWHVTLPTEAQWEKAARGTDRRRFPWGSEPRRDRANFNSGGTVAAGSVACPECAFGLTDMAGNVWEWTRDWYAAGHTTASCCGPDEAASYDPAQPQFRIPRKVIKGGSFLCADEYCLRYRPAARRPQMVDTGMSHIGFRCVRTEPVRRD